MWARSSRITVAENSITNGIEIFEAASGATRVMTSNNDACLRLFDAATFMCCRWALSCLRRPGRAGQQTMSCEAWPSSSHPDRCASAEAHGLMRPPRCSAVAACGHDHPMLLAQSVREGASVFVSGVPVRCAAATCLRGR